MLRFAAIGAAGLALAGCLASETGEPPAISELHQSVVVRLDPGEVQARLSAYRRAHDLPPVTIDPALMALAQSQANVMARANHLSHELAGSLDHRLNASHHAEAMPSRTSPPATPTPTPRSPAGSARPATTPTFSMARCAAWASPPPTRRTRASRHIGR